MWRRRRDPFVAALFVLLPAVVTAQGLFLEGGLSWARGDYVYAQPTNGVGAAVGVAWSSSRLTARVALPWFVRDTRLLTVGGEEPLGEQAGVAGAAAYESSVSDPLVQLGAQVVQGGRTAVGLSAALKIPLVEPGYFGTGEWDVSVAGSLSQFVGRSTMLGLDLSYWRLGDMPDLVLRDTVTGTLTVGQAFGRAWTASLSLSGGRSAIDGYADPWWAGLLVGRAFSRGIWGLTVSVGLSDTAPDFTVGLVWRARLG